MKAVEYFARITATDEEEIMKQFSKCCYDMLINEVNEIKKKRNVKYDRGLIPIFKEQKEKINKLVKLINSEKLKGKSFTIDTDNTFDKIIVAFYPETAQQIIDAIN